MVNVLSDLTRRYWDEVLDRLSWLTARRAVEAVRYEPRYLDLLLACGANENAAARPLNQWLIEMRARPEFVRASSIPHALVTKVAAAAGTRFGPTGSAVVRWFSGAVAGAADRAGAAAVERSLGARVHPGLLVPHTHEVVVLAVDMRGFSALTRGLDDTQYLASIVGDYLTELTRVVERHRGVVFQYTGDGLLALFLPELAAVEAPVLLEAMVGRIGRDLHATFDRMHARWKAEWATTGRGGAKIGLGAGASFGRATIGFLGPAGKKQFGVIGEPVNTAAYLCSTAGAGTMLIDCDSFARADASLPAHETFRLRSKKAHQRIDVMRVRYGPKGRA